MTIADGAGGEDVARTRVCTDLDGEGSRPLRVTVLAVGRPGEAVVQHDDVVAAGRVHGLLGETDIAAAKR